MNILLDNSLTLMNEINRCNSIDDVHNFIKKYTSSIGVHNFFAGVMPALNLNPRDQYNHVLFGIWPEEWSNRYFSKGYLEQDPTIHHIRHHSGLIHWQNFQKNENLVMNEAKEFQLIDGYTLPLCAVDGNKIGVSFAGDHLDSSPETPTLLYIVGSLAVHRIIELQDAKQQSQYIRQGLTDREHECLLWIAEGKTNHELSIIMNISGKTVESHISNIMKKLQANSRALIVAKAFRYGLLR